MANEDVIGAKKQVQMYAIEDPNFDGSRMQELVSGMITHIQNKDSDGFSTCISDFNLISPFSKL
jgi:hypothetical protein